MALKYDHKCHCKREAGKFDYRGRSKVTKAKRFEYATLLGWEKEECALNRSSVLEKCWKRPGSRFFPRTSKGTFDVADNLTLIQ